VKVVLVIRGVVVHFIVLKEGKEENKIEKNEEEKTGENPPAKRKV